MLEHTALLKFRPGSCSERCFSMLLLLFPPLTEIFILQTLQRTQLSYDLIQFAFIVPAEKFVLDSSTALINASTVTVETTI